ncbi:hypothetical protein [Prauserella endophytica]|uniref:Uncharacterized protein n=1 Tax=Prauserella endophytica TaxID=1592324 RepID=A0ABY2RSS6_9PSEU|nr:hypothetical protein [Prauserella endophytica]TKG58884.1 hypothetical protein FCN18_37345 [Prauserella endophytica]
MGVFALQRWHDTNTFPAVTAPAGAVLRDTTVSGSGGAWIEKRLYVMYVDAQTSFAFSWTGSRWSSVAALFFSGVAQGLDLAAVPHHRVTGSGTLVPATTVSTVADAGLAWNVFHDTSGTATPPLNFTETHDQNVYASAYRISPGNGSQSATGAIISASQAQIIVSLVALAPAATGGITQSFGRVTEVGTARGFTAAKTRAFNRVTGAGSPRAFTLPPPYGRVTETGAPRAFTATKSQQAGRVTETSSVRAFTQPILIVGFTVGDITGANRVEVDVTGPKQHRTTTGPSLRRTVTGPHTVVEDMTGPATVDTATPTGPAVRRDLDGPNTARTLTGPEV